MDKKIIIGLIVVLVAVLFFVFTREEVVDPLEEAKQVAENWIVDNAPTYVFDGSDLDLVDSEEVEEGRVYSFTFSFESRAAGYGDRTDEAVAQVITPHVIEVIVEDGEVVSAVTDGVYDEMEGEMLEEEPLPETMRINLYFVKVEDGEEEVVAVERSVPYTVETARTAIEELLGGPLPNEEAEGFSTAIPEGTELNSVSVQDGVAMVDFNQKLQEGVAGSAWVTAIREQIEKTLLQFETVNDVVIMIDGESEEILQP